jgi:hypothetical protein
MASVAEQQLAREIVEMTDRFKRSAQPHTVTWR